MQAVFSGVVVESGLKNKRVGKTAEGQAVYDEQKCTIVYVGEYVQPVRCWTNGYAVGDQVNLAGDLRQSPKGGQYVSDAHIIGLLNEGEGATK